MSLTAAALTQTMIILLTNYTEGDKENGVASV